VILYVESSGKASKGALVIAADVDESVIASELEGSWRAGGQQEGLQYNGEAA